MERHNFLRGLGAAMATGVVLVAAVLVGQQLAERRGDGVGAPATPSPIPTTEPSPTLPSLVTHDSTKLGYQIQLPDGYRRSDCLSDWHSSFARFGADTFTLLSPEEERLRELGHVAGGGRVGGWTFVVAVHLANGMSALQLAERGGCPGCVGREPRPEEQIETLVIGGHEAARVVVATPPTPTSPGRPAEALLYVVSVEDFLYAIRFYSFPHSDTPRPDLLPQSILDAVALTFRPGPEAPSLPTPTPRPEEVPPAAQEAAVRLAAALETGDADALAALATPRCWLYGRFLGAGPGGFAVEPYLARLRERIETGQLRIAVDPTVHIAEEPGPGGSYLYVRSEWIGWPGELIGPSRTSPVDLYLHEIDGVWYWAGFFNRWEP